MPISPFFRLLVMTLIVFQLVGPGLLWAMEQRGVEVRRHNQAVVSGIRGSDLTVLAGETTRPVRFSEPIVFGEQVRTARDSSAEVLINNQVVVTMLSESDVALEERDGHTVVHLSKGSVLVSAAASALREGQTVIVETPGAQLSTRGGLLKAVVGTESRQTERKQESEGGVQLVSYSPIYPVQTEAMVNERFEVYEGTGTIGTRTAGATPLIIEPGQSVQMTGGTLGTPGGIEGALAGPGPTLLAVTHHAATPQAGLDLVSQRQMQQVSALQQALYGDPDATVEGKEGQSGTIISTLFGTNPTQAPPPDSNNPTASLFGSGSPYTVALLAAVNRGGSGLVDDQNGDGSGFLNSFKKGEVGEFGAKGGVGLLLLTERKFDVWAPNAPSRGPLTDTVELFEKTTLTATSELLRIDAGQPVTAPHGGKAPTDPLIVAGLSPRYPSPSIFSPGKQVTNQSLPLQFDSSSPSDVLPRDVLHFIPTGFSSRGKYSVVIIPGDIDLSDTQIPSNRIFDGREGTIRHLGLFSSESDGALAVTAGSFANSFIDASITARSPLTGNRFVTLSGGVVLDKGTTVTIGETQATKQAFQQFGNEFTGSVLSVLAKDGNPAFLEIQNRALGVLYGSSITETSGRVALLSILDSRVIGPGSTSAEGRQPGDVPPLLELYALDNNLQPTGTAPRVDVTSAVVVRSSNISGLDGALLEASSPILAMAYGNMTAKSHFADFSGTNGKQVFQALVPNDALVRLNHSNLTVNGNLFQFNNASASVTGRLFSLDNGSSLTINGVVLSLLGRSTFNLTADSFGSFGKTGTNTLTVNNNLCAGGGCRTINGIKVAGGGTVNLPSDFSPFSSADGSARNADGTERLKLGQNSAFLSVAPNSTLNVKVKR